MKTVRDGEISAVLFDVDGTLADTERDGHRLAFNAAFAEFGLTWSWDVELYGKLLEEKNASVTTWKNMFPID